MTEISNDRLQEFLKDPMRLHRKKDHDKSEIEFMVEMAQELLTIRQQNDDLSESLMDLQSRDLYDEVKVLQSENAELIKWIESKRRTSHYECEDCWYSCPKAERGCCNEHEGAECTCGTDDWNAEIDALMARVKGE